MMIVSALLLMTALTGCDKNRKTSSGSSANMVPGMWQTASMGYEYYGTLQPEYYVQFTNSEIIYGIPTESNVSKKPRPVYSRYRPNLSMEHITLIRLVKATIV